MKFVLVLLAALACASAVPAHKAVHASSGLSKTLDDDLNEFLAFIPIADIEAIVLRYLDTDAQVQEMFVFLLGDEFEAMIAAIDAEPTFLAILNFLEAQNVKIYDFLNRLHEILGLPSIPKPTGVAARGVQKGWREMWNEIAKILPLNEMKTWHCAKLAAGQEWATLYNALQGEEFRGLLNAFRPTASWQALLTKLAEYGVRTEVIVEHIQKFFNWDTDGIDYCA